MVFVAEGTRPAGEHAEVGRDRLLKELKLAELVVDEPPRSDDSDGAL